MKIAPVHADTLIYLGLGGAVLVSVYMLMRKTGSVVADVVDQVAEGVDPTNPDNVANRVVTKVGDVFVSPDGPGRNADGSWTAGGAAYDLTHPDPVTGKWWWQK